MTLEYGSAAFKESHAMVYGLPDYNNQSLKAYNYNMQILSYSTEKEDDDSEGINATTQEIEANIIAKDIKEKMNNNFKVFDSDSKALRDAKYSDFAILIDRGTSFEIIKKILESKNIPVSIEADLKLNEDNITLILSSLVNLVVLTKNHTFNSNYYHYFMSIARSYLFMMDDAKIYDIVMSAKDGYGFKNEEPKSNIISDKIKMIASHLNEFSNSDIFTMLIDEFELIKKLPLVGNTQSKLIIIDRIRNYIDSWSSFGESLDTISEYIKEMLNDDNNKYSIDTTGSDAVRIMTIHKSKGLEFPICYFPMLDKKFMEAVKESVGLNVRYGMYFSKESIIRALAKTKERSLDLSERIRLFYVALTRAREQMILISPNLKKEINYVDEIRSFNDMLNYVKDDLNNYIVNIDLSTYEIDDAYQRRKKLKDIKYHEKPIYNNVSYLSDIISQNRISKEVIEVLLDREQENLDLGLKYHRYMELLDFNNIDTSNIKEPNIKADIELVLNNDIMKELSKAKTYHEHEFIFLDKKTNETFHGIIDLLAVYDDHIDIIDYKLFHIDDLAYDRQLSIYKRYVESISNLPIRCYLLSLALNKVREVKI
jgi:ATP-dependent helicase/nuclease subunit A